MHTMHRFCSLTLFASLPLVALLAGCGGGSSPITGSSSASTTQTFGSLTTRLVGSAQSPVLSTGFGSAVVGIAGASFTDISQSYTAKNLANTKIAFMSQRNGNNEIYAMNADGSNPIRLTNNAATDYYPSFSGDGTKIAFTSGRDGNNEVYSMNADGSNPTRLTNNPAFDFAPSFSGDGTKIAFTSIRDGNNEIYSMNADGTGQTRLTNDAASDFAPSFSGDGTRISFTSSRNGAGNDEIYSINADGTGVTRLTNNVANDGFASFSSDGTRIVFQSIRDGNNEIYAMNADGTGQTRLTNNLASDDNPSFSPDGTKITFSTTRDGNYEIYVMNADGTGQTRLTSIGGSDDYPSWSGFQQPKYVGAGGILGIDCAGFLVGQQGQINTGLLIFDTPTVASRAGSRVTANTNADTNSPNLAFTITTTTGLSSLKFVNTTQSLVPISPAIPTGSTNALVLFDSATGLVVSVIPYTANRSQSSTNRVQNGDMATYTGHFTAIFDATGKNLAPGGATSVTLDEKNGKLVKFN
jgi:hypothetical protein